MTDYRTILAEALRVEDKASRDQVLARLDPRQRQIVRNMMSDLAKRLTTYVARGETRSDRRTRLQGIPELWLRDRVETMVRERFQKGGARNGAALQ